MICYIIQSKWALYNIPSCVVLNKNLHDTTLFKYSEEYNNLNKLGWHFEMILACSILNSAMKDKDTWVLIM